MTYQSIQDQMKVIRSRVAIDNHRLFNAAAQTIQKKLEAEIPGLTLVFGEKSVQGDQISATLKGAAPNEDGGVDAKVRKVIDSLKNPSAFNS